jgi:hypothetical protein
MRFVGSVGFDPTCELCYLPPQLVGSPSDLLALASGQASILHFHAGHGLDLVEVEPLPERSQTGHDQAI